MTFFPGFSFLPRQTQKMRLRFPGGGKCVKGGEKEVNLLNIGLGVCAALVYAFLGYAAQDKPFDWRKFLRTIAISSFSALGLDMAGMTFSVYAALVGPTAITVWLTKLVDTAKS